MKRKIHWFSGKKLRGNERKILLLKAVAFPQCSPPNFKKVPNPVVNVREKTNHFVLIGYNIKGGKRKVKLVKKDEIRGGIQGVCISFLIENCVEIKV